MGSLGDRKVLSPGPPTPLAAEGALWSDAASSVAATVTDDILPTQSYLGPFFLSQQRTVGTCHCGELFLPLP